ncbi:MAG: HAMP domain-containing sensor histidine kinase [Myxococcota bacterium]|nr:HAMP domain-containing sensor histidine kinase [Myxococcota bacterium]
MKLGRGLRSRLLGLSALAVILVGSVTYFLTLWQFLPLTAINDGQLILMSMERGESARCEADPRRWSLTTPEGMVLYAYDHDTLTSHNPDALPLDGVLLKQLRRGELYPGRLYFRFGTEEVFRAYGGSLLTRVADDGPCAIIQLTWPLRMSKRLQAGLLFLGLLLGACVALISFLFSRFSLTPLLERIGEINAMADRVGREGESLVVSSPQREDAVARDELDVIARALEDAHARILKDADTLRQRQYALERHISEVTHDLRTPLTALGLALEELARGARNERSETEIEALSVSIQELSYMSSLIDNLRLGLDLRDGALPRREALVDLGQIAEKVARRQLLAARQRQVSLNCAYPDLPLNVLADPLMAEQVVTNLVQNAIMYNDPGGNVALVLDETETGWRLMILDDGPGVLPEQLESLAARTFRTDEARSRNPAGDGLGLAIVHAVCQRYGWSLSFDTVAPRGLRVEITGSLQEVSSNPTEKEARLEES